ncbi:MAG: V-type ATP synthase subunit I, partial [Oscillospiraceae bacterium]
PAKNAEKTVKSLNEIEGITAIETPNDADARLKPPTRLKNNFLVRPFELIVKMYGLPRYGDIDPTVYVAITYTLLFGAMFGDVGQGLVIFLAGLVMAHILKMDFGKILERIGLSSTLFGFLYGSVFGFEHLLDPFYKAVFGLDEKPIEVFEQSNTLLLTAIAIGAVLISVSIILNIILSFRHKNLEEAVFGNNGVAGFIFYAALLAALALRFLFDVNVLNPFYIFFLIVLPLLLIFFKQPLGKLISGKKKIAPENGIGEFIAENFFEMFEYLLSYATNTMSFLRVGGFVLSHAGMMLVVFSLAEMFQATGSVIVIIIGNIFVMGMEGLIVGIQALRLQFYEVFGRFFVADGKEFIPVSAKKSDK